MNKKTKALADRLDEKERALFLDIFKHMALTIFDSTDDGCDPELIGANSWALYFAFQFAARLGPEFVDALGPYWHSDEVDAYQEGRFDPSAVSKVLSSWPLD